MDKRSMFEEMLQTDQPSVQAAEDMWDQKAETFYYNQVNGSTYYAEAVPRLLEQKGVLTSSSSVLDIGAGSGRYTIPIAKKSATVHALDLSSEMLQFMQQEMEKNNLDNIHTIKSAWPAEEEIGEFDVAFAAMCPATRSVEALKEMSNVAKRYGVICQFTASTDNVVEALKDNRLIQEAAMGPHNNRDILQAYFNILWELGYSPEVSYLPDTFELEMNLDEALDSYQQRYEHLELDQLKHVLEPMTEDTGKIKVEKNTTLAVLNWKTGR